MDPPEATGFSSRDKRILPQMVWVRLDQLRLQPLGQKMPGWSLERALSREKWDFFRV